MATYLAYGSNLWPSRLAGRVGACTVTATVALPGWSLVFDKRGADGSGKCTLVADSTACAHGVLYRLPDSAWEVLDRIEGRGHGYERETLTFPDHGPCDVYRAQPGARHPALRPYDWYLRLVFAGAAHHGFPAAYLTAIAAVPVQADLDIARAARELAALSNAPCADTG